MGHKLLITPYRGRIISALYEDRHLLQVSADERRRTEICIGGIYIGKVKNIVKNINAAFVELKPGVMSYLALDESIPPITANVHADGKIHAGDEFVVQVVREPVKSKLASVTCAFNLTGKYAVLIYGKNNIGISAKISDPERRAYLREFFLQYAGEDYGFIVRTNAEGATDKELVEEILSLKERCEKIRTHGVHRTRFSVLEEPMPAYICSLRDQYQGELDEILTDESTLYEEIRSYLLEFQPEDLEKLRLYAEELPLKTLYSFEHRLREALQKKVWLKSGASLVIEPTEALTVIDVNTGKAVKGKSRGEDYFLKINLEAAKEIAYQIRLRNLSGIILVDFIDMQEKVSDEILLQTLKEYLAADPIKTTFVDMTPLHLVEITRKKVRRPLYEENFEGGMEDDKDECDADFDAGGN